MLRTSIAGPAIAAATLVVLMAGPAVADNRGADRSHAPASLQGSWEVTITPQDCITGDPFPAFAFNSLMTFHAGGTMTETTANPTFQPGQRSLGAGYWLRSGRREYDAVFQAYIQFTGGNYTRGHQRVEQAIAMQDDDHWTAALAIAFVDPMGGTTRPPGCASVVASRMP
ncbi:MAG: hypothetical protein JSS46_14875 [Proteobacteria bacterium]|jgi:hypothetical protein|nr:hypothetical protein [Pseudomonadota bacterium]